MSDRRLMANKTNALKSTGPRTQDGKAAVSRNAVRHGLLSNRLFLDDEDPSEFDALQCDLQRSLNPVGAMELALVERIAINMWRQRRLVAAETATILLQREPKRLTADVSSEICLGYGNELSEDDLMPIDIAQVRWSKVVIDEIERLEEIDLRTLKKNAPHVFGQLKSDAEEDDSVPEEYLEDFEGGLTSYVAEIHSYCRKQLEEAEKRPHILAVAEQVRQKRLILPPSMLTLFARYQTTIDNQIYKALKALRETQEWRLKTIDASLSAGGQDDAQVA